MTEKCNNDAVQRFRRYLQIPSVHPNIDYYECVEFLKNEADVLHLPVAVYEFVPKKPIVVITWEGLKPQLPSILLNSHMDVVPVYEEHWTHPPFKAHVAEDGFIYARGTQDMKSVGMIHLEAVKRLKNAGVKLKRTVHISFVPDEEINSKDGMKEFAKSEQFKKLNIGISLDESCPSQESDKIIAFYGERTSKPMKVTCTGLPGHGLFLSSNTAGEKFTFLINKFMNLRAEEKKKFDAGALLGELITINLTVIEGGVQVNVVPGILSATFDIRIPPNVNIDDFDKMVKSWCDEAGEGCSYEYVAENSHISNTEINDDLHFWTALKKTLDELNLKVKWEICPGGTDARFVREQGIPAIGFTPILNTPILLHAHDERIHVDEFLRGIDIMEKVVHAIANV